MALTNYAKYEAKITALGNVSPVQRIKGFIAIGNDGYYKGYNLAGVAYFQDKEYEKAYEYYKKALELNPENDFILNNMGQLLATKGTPYFNEKEAITYLKTSNCSLAYKNLANIYNPIYREDGFDSYKNKEKAIEYYKKAIRKGGSKVNYNEIGMVYADVEKSDVPAACYFYLGKRYGNSNAANNYSIYIKKVKKEYGSFWVRYIEALRSIEQIDVMISIVNELIRKPSRFRMQKARIITSYPSGKS